MKRLSLVSMVLGVLMGASYLAAESPFVVQDRMTAARVVPAGMFPELAGFQGFASDLTVDPNNWCFGAVAQQDFSWGSTVGTNSFWADTADADGINEYTVTFAVKLPSGVIQPLTTYTATFPGLTPGLTYQFCAAEGTTTPPSGPSGLAIPWGKKVVQIGSVDSAQGQLGTLVFVP